MIGLLGALLQEDPALDPSFVVDVSYLTPLVALFIPILVGVLSKSTARSSTKALLNAGLAALSGFITTVIANAGAFTIKEFVTGVILSWVTSWAAYNGFLKPAGVTDRVQESTQTFGIGGRTYGVEFTGEDELHHVDGELLALYEELESQGKQSEDLQ